MPIKSTKATHRWGGGGGLNPTGEKPTTKPMPFLFNYPFVAVFSINHLWCNTGQCCCVLLASRTNLLHLLGYLSLWWLHSSELLFHSEAHMGTKLNSCNPIPCMHASPCALFVSLLDLSLQVHCFLLEVPLSLLFLSSLSLCFTSAHEGSMQHLLRHPTLPYLWRIDSLLYTAFSISWIIFSCCLISWSWRS